MQIVIDIPEDVYTRLFDNGIQDNEIAVDDICEMARSLRQGTPLNKIIYKINEEMTFWELGGNTELVVYGMKQALGIIEEDTGVSE